MVPNPPAVAPAAPTAIAPSAPPAAPPAEKEGFFRGLAGGLYSSTLKPLGHMVMHPVETVEGVGHAIAHPIDTGKALGHAVVETGRGVLSGDGRSIGTAAGTIGMLFIPGAGEAGAAEDAARVGQLGELADVSKVGEVADVADASTETGVVSQTGGEVGAESSPLPNLSEEPQPPSVDTPSPPPDPPVEPPDPIAERQAANEALRSSPQFRTDMADAGVNQEQIDNMFAKEAPLGFESPEQFAAFKGDLNSALTKSGLDDAEVGMKGTSTTFYSENPGKPLGHYFDRDPANPADYDLNVASDKMVQTLDENGAQLSKKYNIYNTETMNETFPHLDDFSTQWTKTLGRDVNIVGLPSAPVRDATEYILASPK